MKRIPLAAVKLPIAVLAILVACGGNHSNLTEPWPARIELLISDSIGVAIGDSNYVFGAICDATFGGEGEILVLDQAGGYVSVFSREGDFISRIGGPGPGPGELSLPLSLARLGDGRIFVLDPMSNSYETYDGLDYSFIEEVSVWGNNPPMDPWGLDGDAYIGLKFEMIQEQGTLTGSSILGRFAMGQEHPEISYWAREFPVDLSDLGAMVKNMLFSTVFAGDREGRIFYSEMSTSRYEAVALAADGTEIFRVIASISPVIRSDIEMELEKEYMESWISRMGGIGEMPIHWQPEEYRWMISGMGVDSLGGLWIQRGTELAPVFDVFDRAGNHQYSAVLPREGWSWKFHISEEGMLGWEEDPESGVQKIYIIGLSELTEG